MIYKKSLLQTFVARSSVAFSGILLIYVVSNYMGNNAVAQLALIQSFILGFGIITKFGMDMTIIRLSGGLNNKSLVKAFFYCLSFSILLSLLVLIAICFIYYLGFEKYILGWGGGTSSYYLIMVMPVFSMVFVSSGFFKAISKPALGSLLESGGSNLFALFFIVSSITLGNEVSFELVLDSFFYAAIAQLILVIISCLIWYFNGKVNLEVVEFIDISSILKRSWVFFTTNLAVFFNSVLLVYSASYILNDGDLAVFRTLTQLSMSLTFILVVLNSILTPKFSKLYASKKITEIFYLAGNGVLISLFFCIPLFLLLVVFSDTVLLSVANLKDIDNRLFYVCLIAQLINVSTGSVGMILNMTGFEKEFRMVVLSFSIFGLIGFYFLSMNYGLYGAICTWAAIIILQNITSLLLVKKNLGQWVIPVFK